MDVKVREALARAEDALRALVRSARAARGAVGVARTARYAVRARRDDLAGARMQRAESLLAVSRSELAAAESALRAALLAEGCVATGSSRRWDTPPPEWWMRCAAELNAHVRRALGGVGKVQAAWTNLGSNDADAAGGNEDEYTALVVKMAVQVEGARDGLQKAMDDMGGWRDIVAAVGDGLPASHSVARRLPL